jgi:hypothetical protein
VPVEEGNDKDKALQCLKCDMTEHVHGLDHFRVLTPDGRS